LEWLLQIEEVVDVMAVKPISRPRFDIRDRMLIPEEVIRYCFSLVTVIRRRTYDWNLIIGGFN
jgi:hypothetical protein